MSLTDTARTIYLAATNDKAVEGLLSPGSKLVRSSDDSNAWYSFSKVTVENEDALVAARDLAVLHSHYILARNTFKTLTGHLRLTEYTHLDLGPIHNGSFTTSRYHIGE